MADITTPLEVMLYKYVERLSIPNEYQKENHVEIRNLQVRKSEDLYEFRYDYFNGLNTFAQWDMVIVHKDPKHGSYYSFLSWSEVAGDDWRVQGGMTLENLQAALDQNIREMLDPLDEYGEPIPQK